MPWTSSDPTWASLDPYQRAAAMALMEANSGKNQQADATHVLGAMVNRARQSGEDLGAHVSRPIYQPTFEPAQRARLPSILNSPNFPTLSNWARERWQGNREDNVGGATHFLAPEGVMEGLTAREPQKYRSWKGWTGYGKAQPGQYSNPDGAPVFRDGSHAFLAPEGAYSAPGSYGGSGFKKAEFDNLADAFGPDTPTLKQPAPFAASPPTMVAGKPPAAEAPRVAAAAPPAAVPAADPAKKEPQQPQSPFAALQRQGHGIDDSDAVKVANAAAMDWLASKRKKPFMVA